MTPECPRERDVVAAVIGRRWASADEALKVHASACEVCQEVAAVASLLSSHRDAVRHDIHVPAAGQVWWRSAVRARLEAAQAAARPLTWLHGIAGACALGLAVAVVGMAWPSIRGGAAWFTAQALGADSSVGDVVIMLSAAIQKSLPLALVVAACIILAPLAVYFALADD